MQILADNVVLMKNDNDIASILLGLSPDHFPWRNCLNLGANWGRDIHATMNRVVGAISSEMSQSGMMSAHWRASFALQKV